MFLWFSWPSISKMWFPMRWEDKPETISQLQWWPWWVLSPMSLNRYVQSDRCVPFPKIRKIFNSLNDINAVSLNQYSVLILLYPFSSIFFDKHPLQHLHQSNWFYQSISFHSSRRISLHVHYQFLHWDRSHQTYMEAMQWNQKTGWGLLMHFRHESWKLFGWGDNLTFLTWCSYRLGPISYESQKWWLRHL